MAAPLKTLKTACVFGVAFGRLRSLEVFVQESLLSYHWAALAGAFIKAASAWYTFECGRVDRRWVVMFSHFNT